MNEILGASLGPFLGVTVALGGFIALLTGQELAEAWRSPIHAIVASFGLSLADRFLAFALFDGVLTSIPGFVVSWAFLAAVALLSWRVTLVRKMVRQYPWLYEPVGLLSWRERGAT